MKTGFFTCLQFQFLQFFVDGEHLVRWHLEILFPLEDQFRLVAFFSNSWLETSYKCPKTSLIICCGAFDVSCPRLALPRHHFRGASHTVTNRLLLLRLPTAFQCDFGRLSWGWESFEQYSISVSRNNIVDAICWHRIVRDDCM